LADIGVTFTVDSTEGTVSLEIGSNYGHSAILRENIIVFTVNYADPNKPDATYEPLVFRVKFTLDACGTLDPEASLVMPNADLGQYTTPDLSSGDLTTQEMIYIGELKESTINTPVYTVGFSCGEVTYSLTEQPDFATFDNTTLTLDFYTEYFNNVGTHDITF
jgi:hypothetical protein